MSLILTHDNCNYSAFSLQGQFLLTHKDKIKDGSTFDKIVILPGFSSPKADYPAEENHDFFKQNLKIYEEAADFWQKRKGKYKNKSRHK